MVGEGWLQPAGVGVALAVALGCGVALLRRRFLVVTVRGPSMEPTLHEGDRVLVRRRTLAELGAGDVVVFAELPRVPGGWLVKRAVAVAGDPVPRHVAPALSNVDHDRVPPGSLVALGDNASASHDSRHYGYVTADRLLGVVLRKL